MNHVGYSETPLVKKLGFKKADTVFVEDTPNWYSDFARKNHFELTPGLPATHAHIFFSSTLELENFLKENNLNNIVNSLWVSWPKKNSGVKTNLTEQTFRNKILPLGWVDIKVAAIDESWSGLKFVRRKVLS